MDTAQGSSTINPGFNLSARQEQLLFAALNFNNKTNITTNNPQSAMASASLTDSPHQAPGSATLGFEESPYIDYDNEFDLDPAGDFDYDFSLDMQGQMIGTLPGTSLPGTSLPATSSSDGDADNHDKRAHEDDGEDEEGGGKRREGDERTGKKPGRKPLTSEPTSKRKAQNRAAQRAFRERKEKHLKDLETKVEDLEKASESANHENSILRAQVEKMSMELREYRKRVSLNGGLTQTPASNHGLPSYLAGKGLSNTTANNPNDVSFQFEFPRFGRLPGPNTTGMNATFSPAGVQQIPKLPEKTQISSRKQSMAISPTDVSIPSLTANPGQLDAGDMSNFSGLFSPSLLESVGKSPPFDFFSTAQNNSGGSRSSTDSATGNTSTGHNTSYSSPSSTNSNHGLSSSCGTSPEPTMQSPNYGKGTDTTLTTIGEEQSGSGEGELTFCDKLNMACGNPNNPVPRTMSEFGDTSGNMDLQSFDINGIDWFAQQNGNQFDPQLFNDYREPQDNILSGDAFADNFFSEAYALPDFNSPFNMAPSPAPVRKDLVQQIDDQQNGDDEVVPGEDRSTMLTCNTIWDRLQSCPKVKDGEFDLDMLCKDLQKKAKCSETGAVVNESDFNKIMKSYVNKGDGTKTTSNKA